jgi:hypothetical protein
VTTKVKPQPSTLNPSTFNSQSGSNLPGSCPQPSPCLVGGTGSLGAHHPEPCSMPYAIVVGSRPKPRGCLQGFATLATPTCAPQPSRVALHGHHLQCNTGSVEKKASKNVEERKVADAPEERLAPPARAVGGRSGGGRACAGRAAGAAGAGGRRSERRQARVRRTSGTGAPDERRSLAAWAVGGHNGLLALPGCPMPGALAHTLSHSLLALHA